MIRIVLATSLLFLAACQPNIQAAPSFDEALEKHIAAIESRDLESYIQTITTGNDLPLILPNGTMLETRQDAIDLHTAWFKDKEWVQKQDVLNTHVNGNMAVATIKYSYQDTPDGPPRYTYLGLVFELQDGAWRLIYDQNTRIPQIEN